MLTSGSGGTLCAIAGELRTFWKVGIVSSFPLVSQISSCLFLFVLFFASSIFSLTNASEIASSSRFLLCFDLSPAFRFCFMVQAGFIAVTAFRVW